MTCCGKFEYLREKMLIWQEDSQWYIHLTDGLVNTNFDEDIIITNCPFCGATL